MDKKKKVNITKTIMVVVCLILIILPIVVYKIKSKFEITDSSLLSNTFFPTIELTLDKHLYEVSIEVSFYSVDDVCLGKYTSTAYPTDKNADFEFYSAPSFFYRYEIQSCSGKIEKYYVYYIVIGISLIFSISLLVDALMLKCKVYEFGGNEIVVYSGFFNDLLIINGEKIDEFHRLVGTNYIYVDFSATIDDDELAVRISGKHITVHMNGQMLYPIA